jgi:predicted nucleotidyltransferase
MSKPDVQDALINRLGTSFETIVAFCQRWKITEFALFGSVLRDDFRPDSDIDVLVTFAPGDGWSLFDLMNLQRELESMVGRRVDLLEKREIKNPFRRAEILRTHQVIHASQ